MEIDILAQDWSKAIGQKSGKTVKPVGKISAAARDFDTRTDTLTFITTDREFIHDTITQVDVNPADFFITGQDFGLGGLGKIVRLNDKGQTRYKTFARYENTWVFGRDAGEEGDSAKRLQILANDKTILNLSDRSDTEALGTYIWVSSDMNGGDGAVVAVSRIDISIRNGFSGKIEFYKVIPGKGPESSQLFKLDYEIPVSDLVAFETAEFVQGDFVWQASKQDGLQRARVCPSTHYLEYYSRQCIPCQPGFGTSDIMQTTCISCNEMYRQGGPLEKAVAYKICTDPTVDASVQVPEGNQDELAQTDQETEKKLYLDNWEEHFIEWIWAEGWIYGAVVLGFFLAFNLFLCIVLVKCCGCRYKNGRQKTSEDSNAVNDSSRRPLQQGDKSDAQTPALFNTIELCDAECQTDKGKF